MTITKAKTLNEWLTAKSNSHNRIDAALAEWLLDSNWPDTGEGIANAIRQLEMTNCADCNAPAGLIYTSDLMDKLGIWKREILDALNEYYDATGEEYKTGEPGNFVWFVIEWRAHDLASALRNEFGVEG